MHIIRYAHVLFEYVLAAAITRERRLFLSAHLEVRLLFESGDLSRAASDRANTVLGGTVYFLTTAHPKNSNFDLALKIER